LENKLGKDIFHNKRIVDTLLWSPLLFSENPYHKLVKGYKIVNERDINNPLSDCKLTRQLLLEELNRFNEIDIGIRNIYASLLSNSMAYSGFFQLAKFPNPGIN